MSKAKTAPAKQAILEVLRVEPQASVAQIAVSAGVGRSTASKLLAQLESDRDVRRTAGGRDGNRRLPDLWSLTDRQVASRGAKAKPASGRSASKPAVANANGDERLKAGGLDPLVLDYLKQNADSGPHGPVAVAKALGRSSGAVANCLARLAAAKKVREVGEKPRRYSLPA
jgi:DNA-binding Lrp family transcriptional regulator